MERKAGLSSFSFLRHIVLCQAKQLSYKNCNKYLEQLGKSQLHTRRVVTVNSTQVQVQGSPTHTFSFSVWKFTSSQSIVTSRESPIVPKPFKEYSRKYTTDIMSEPQLKIVHDSKNDLFYIDLSDGSLKNECQAMLEYSWTSPTSVEMYHTEVPPQFQGKGIAKLLAKAAFDHFSENGILMAPTCTYLQKYLRENPLPQYMEHVEKK